MRTLIQPRAHRHLCRSRRTLRLVFVGRLIGAVRCRLPLVTAIVERPLGLNFGFRQAFGCEASSSWSVGSRELYWLHTRHLWLMYRCLTRNAYDSCTLANCHSPVGSTNYSEGSATEVWCWSTAGAARRWLFVSVRPATKSHSSRQASGHSCDCSAFDTGHSTIDDVHRAAESTQLHRAFCWTLA